MTYHVGDPPFVKGRDPSTATATPTSISDLAITSPVSGSSGIADFTDGSSQVAPAGTWPYVSLSRSLIGCSQLSIVPDPSAPTATGVPLPTEVIDYRNSDGVAQFVAQTATRQWPTDPTGIPDTSFLDVHQRWLCPS